MWLYSMRTMPFLKGMRGILGEQGLAAFYADDGNLHASFETMVELVKYRRPANVAHRSKIQKYTAVAATNNPSFNLLVILSMEQTMSLMIVLWSSMTA